MNAASIVSAMSALTRFRLWYRRLIRRVHMADAGKFVTLWCRACDGGYYSRGEVPTLCPRCEKQAHWTTTPPFKLTVDDKNFLKVNRIRSD
jgi:hypothetical protein